MTSLQPTYTAPKLTIFGAMSELTAGGASGVSETAFINMMTCGTALMKKCG